MPMFLTAGKLDLAFRLRGNAIAGSWTIAPGAESAKNRAVANRATAFENQWTMHAAVRSDNKDDLDCGSVPGGNHKRIGSRKSLWRLGAFAMPPVADMRNVVEFGAASQGFPGLLFMSAQICLGRARIGLHGSHDHSGTYDRQEQKSCETKHTLNCTLHAHSG
jgi:hypothetical protein